MTSFRRPFTKSLLSIATVFLFLGGCGEPSGKIVWPPRTHTHDQEAAGIPSNANGIVVHMPDRISFSGPVGFDASGNAAPGGGFKLDGLGNITPMGGFSSGTLVTSIGSIEKRASFGGRSMIWEDKTLSKVIQEIALYVYSGEVLITKDQLLNQGALGYTENRFSIEDFGDDMFIVKLDPSKKHRLCLLRDGTPTAGFVGTKIDHQGVVVERKADGWYVDQNKLTITQQTPRQK